MNLIDFAVIYFSVGAPFAVYYFLQNRRTEKSFFFWLKIVSVFIFWLPFAAALLLRSESRRRFFSLNFLKDFLADDADREIFRLQKRLENLLIKSDLEISTFDYREVAERYAGLTTAANSQTARNFEFEVFRIAENENVKLGSICLERRNRNKLLRHQIEARRDFLQIVRQMFDSISDTEALRNSSIQLVKKLKDDAAQQSLEKMFAEESPTAGISSAADPEKDLWKPQERQPLRSETISTRL